MAEKDSLLHTLLNLAMIVEARDAYTGGHLWRASQVAKILAEALGLNQKEIACCQIGGFLHDVGKIGVPDAILNNPHRLNTGELAVIRTHPDVGLHLLARHPLGDLVKDAVGLHHEHMDGSGYPHGLMGQDIPLVARVVSIADSFDAMTSTRSYRKGLPIDTTLAVMTTEMAPHLDQELCLLLFAPVMRPILNQIVGFSEAGLPLTWCPCGTPIALHHTHHDGDMAYCHQCGGEAIIHHPGNGQPHLEATGALGTAAQLAPQADLDLIAGMVADVAPFLAA